VTQVHQRYVYATVFALAVALILKFAHVPAPWPAAIAVYIYGLVAKPVITQEMLPNVKPGLYAAICLSAAMLVFVYENLGAYAGW
jgi:hypothetical protein